MPKQITQFKLLVVTPADVTNEMNIIRETVESLNEMYGKINNADIKIQYWSFEEPNQSFSEFDAVIAVFWTQFGTVVEDHISNIKTEIEDHMDNPDACFLYFSDCQARPLQTDSNQHEQVMKFKSKYMNRNNCWIYNALEMFKRLVINQLTLYFVEQLDRIQITSEPKMSDLRIVGVKEDHIIETPKLFRHRFSHSKFITNYKQKIFDILNKINALNLPRADSELKMIEKSDSSKQEDSSKDNSVASENFPKWANTIRTLPNANFVKSFLTEPAKINDEIQNVIIKYLGTIGQKIEAEEFFNLGNLMERLSPLRGVQYGNTASSQLMGSLDEKEKYHLLMDLYANILIYEASYAYLSEIDDLFYLHCVLANVGNGYDEEVEVKLYFDKGFLCKRENLPVPGEGLLETMNPSFELFFKPRQVPDIEPYNAYPEELKKIKLPFYGNHSLLRKQKEKGSQETQLQKIETYFCYEYDQDGEFDVLKYHLDSISQNTQIALPTYLVFKREPRRMKYEIRSKHSANVIHRELSIMRSDR